MNDTIINFKKNICFILVLSLLLCNTITFVFAESTGFELCVLGVYSYDDSLSNKYYCGTELTSIDTDSCDSVIVKVGYKGSNIISSGYQFTFTYDSNVFSIKQIDDEDDAALFNDECAVSAIKKWISLTVGTTESGKITLVNNFSKSTKDYTTLNTTSDSELILLYIALDVKNDAETIDTIFGFDGLETHSNVYYGNAASATQTKQDLSLKSYSIHINGVNPSLNKVELSETSVTANAENDVTLIATASSVMGTNITSNVTWSVSPADKGVTVNNGTVTVDNKAVAGTYTVIAAADGTNILGSSTSASFTVSRVDSVISEVTLDKTAVNVTGGDAAAQTVTAVAKDQYGDAITSGITWDITSTEGLGVSIENGTVTVANNAKAGTYTVGAIYEEVKKTAALSVTRDTAAPYSIEITSGPSATIIVPAEAGNLGYQYTVLVKDQYGETIDKPTVKWSVTEHTGIMINTDSGILTVTADAKEGVTTEETKFTVTASCDSVSATTEFAVKRADAEFTSVEITCAGSGDDVILAIPVSENDAENVTAFTVTAYDQYKTEYTGSVSYTWSILGSDGEADASPEHISVSADGRITVSYGAAADQTYYLKAVSDSGNKFDKIKFTVKALEVNWIEPTVIKTNPEYGDSWKDIVSLSSSSTNATLGAAVFTGALELSEPDVIPNAGTSSYTVTFKNIERNISVLKTYTITNAVAKKTVGLDWGTAEFTYNKQEQLPVATVTGLVGSDKLSASVTGAKTDAGTYTAYASVTSDNYVLDDAVSKKAFEIKAKPVEIVWTNTELTYNADNQKPSAAVKAKDICSGDTLSVTAVSGEQKIPGTYTATAEALTNANYTIGSKKTTQFTVSKKVIDVNWSNTELTYNRAIQGPVATAAGVGSDVLTLTVTGKQTDAAASISAEASIADAELAKCYTLSGAGVSYTISPKTVDSPVIEGISNQTYASYEITFSGIVVKDGSDVIPASDYVVTYSSNEAVGTATVNLKTRENVNYSFDTSAEFEIAPKNVSELTAEAANQNIVVRVGTFAEPVITFNGETVVGTYTYTISTAAFKETGLSCDDAYNTLAGLEKDAEGTIYYTFAPNDNNYTGTASGSFTFTMVDIQFFQNENAATAANTLQIISSKLVYGNAWKDIASVDTSHLVAKVDGKTGSTNEYTVSVTKKNEQTVIPNETKSGAGDYTVSVVYNGTIGAVHYTNVVVCSTDVALAKKSVELVWSDLSLTYNKQAQTSKAKFMAISPDTEEYKDVTVVLTASDTALVADNAVNVGTYHADVTDLANYTFTNPTNVFEITKKEIIISGIKAEDKVYDATTAASLTYADVVYNGICEGDSLTVSAVGSFSDKNAGTAKKVAVNGTELGGTSIANYVLAVSGNQTEASASISALEVCVSDGITADSKTYDGTTAASFNMSGAVISGKIAGDDLSVASVTGAFENKKVSNGSIVYITGYELGGADKGNYVLTTSGMQTFTVAAIVKKTITPTAAGSDFKVTKEYDGTKSKGATSGALKLIGVCGSDEVTVEAGAVSDYPDSAYGTYTVTLSGLTLGGADKDNYELSGTELTFNAATITKIIPKLENIIATMPAVSVYDYTAREIEVTTSGIGLGTLTTWYRQVNTGDSSLGEPTNTKPINAGTYMVEFSFAEGINYEKTTSNITSAAWKIIINKADVRTLEVNGPFVLTQDNKSAKIVVTASGLYNDGAKNVITYYASDSTKVHAYSNGNITALDNGSTAVNVYLDELDNYAGTEASISVYSFLEPLKTNAQAYSRDGLVSAVVDNAKKTITVNGAVKSGNDITVTVASVDTLDKDTIVITDIGTDASFSFTVGTAPNTAALTYAVISKDVTVIPADVIIESGTKEAIAEEFETSNEAIALINDARTRIDDIVTNAAAGLVKAVEEFRKENSETVSDNGVEFIVTVDFNIVAKNMTTNSFSLDLHPVLNIVASKGGTEIATKEGVAISNSDIKAPVRVSVAIRDEFNPKYAKHYFDEQKTKFEYIDVTVSGSGLQKTASWLQGSFSEVELIEDNPTAQVTFVYNDESRTVTNYTLENSSASLPGDSVSDKNFLGWDVYTSNGSLVGRYSSMSETLLRSLSDAGSDAVAYSRFENVYYEDPDPIVIVKPAEEKKEFVNPFTDVEESAYYYESVKWAVEKGIIFGMTDTTFAPKLNCTRAQMVTMLYRAASSPAIEASWTNKFEDVKEGTYYYDAVVWASNTGAIDGMTETTFEPSKDCTRAEMLTMLWKYSGRPEAAYTDKFVDVKQKIWYTNAVSWGVEKNITDGTTETTFEPGKDCFRCEFVTFLYRFYEGK